MDHTILVAKTKALICCAITKQLICVFVFSLAKSMFPHDVAHIFTDLTCFAPGNIQVSKSSTRRTQA